MGKTKIEWVKNKDGSQGRTWNPVTGCTQISPGCANCYAKRMAERFAGPWKLDPGNPFAVKLHPERLDEPLRWNKPSMVFVCSMSDLFHEDVPDEFLDKVFAYMAKASQHTFLVLTKRPERMRNYIIRAMHDEDCSYDGWYAAISEIGIPDASPMENVWIGVTAENQEQANKRIPILLQIPAAKRFVSVEPMLGPVDLRKYLGGNNATNKYRRTGISSDNDGGIGNRQSRESLENRGPKMEQMDSNNKINTVQKTTSGEEHGRIPSSSRNDQQSEVQCTGSSVSMATFSRADTERIDCQSQKREEVGQRPEEFGIGNLFGADKSCDSRFGASSNSEQNGAICWVICGGESGPNARPMHPDWARSLRDQCRSAGVPFMFKQWGEWAPFYDRDKDPDWENVPKESKQFCRINLAGGHGFHGDRVVYFQKVGKKISGRLLDGELWDQYPDGTDIDVGSK